MPCGSGKSLVAFWAAEALNAKSVVVAVPSLYLIGQALEDWAKEYLAKGLRADWLVICSDETTSQLNRDEFVGEAYELGIKTTTDTEEIKDFLRKRRRQQKVIFVTYQSGRRLIEAADQTGFKFDLTILDEAHKTVGYRTKPFAALVTDKAYQSKKRIFMTATERVLRGKNDDVLSMADDVDYGELIFEMNFGEAISAKPSIISDYKIVSIAVSESRIRKLIDQNSALFAKGGEFEEVEAKDVGACLAMQDLFGRGSGSRAISFHNSIPRSEDFKRLSEVVSKLVSSKPIEHFHVSSKMTSGQRTDLVRQFAASPQSLITNARCLTEGVDVPAVDTVIFADPKTSVTDIVQASGRALRLHEGKKLGYIMLPLIVPDGMEFEDFALTTEFRHVARVVTALSLHDYRIVEEFRVIAKDRRRRGRSVEITGDLSRGVNIDFDEFADSITAQIWRNVGRANWRPFEEARAFVRSLNLGNAKEWQEYTKSGNCPADIPSVPERPYQNKGWVSYGDWLGNDRISSWKYQYLPFEEARTYVQSLGLKSWVEWLAYARSGEKPDDIPTKPERTYRDKGWNSMGDWLGTGTIAPFLLVYRSFEDARKFVRSLGLKTKREWDDYCKSGDKPDDIPAGPQNTYSDSGWKGVGDWLGTGTIASHRRVYRSFEEAREFVQTLGLKTRAEWEDYCKSGDKPDDIPVGPQNTYKDKGWVGVGDWLGTGTIANQNRKHRPFKAARDFVQALGLKSQAEWRAYTKSEKFPYDIPVAVNVVYKNEGWIGWGDWLGTSRSANQDIEFRPFEDARQFVQALRLKTTTQWLAYARSGEKPDDIPTNPHRTYRDKGWAGMSDWLGTGRAPRGKLRPFKRARAYARGLGLRTSKDWKSHANSGNLPADIPRTPWKVYRDKGWKSISDWLGTE